jgi:hypothetical protein
MQNLWELHQHDEDWDFLFIDAKNAFNEQNRTAMLWAVRQAQGLCLTAADIASHSCSQATTGPPTFFAAKKAFPREILSPCFGMAWACLSSTSSRLSSHKWSSLGMPIMPELAVSLRTSVASFTDWRRLGQIVAIFLNHPRASLLCVSTTWKPHRTHSLTLALKSQRGVAAWEASLAKTVCFGIGFEKKPILGGSGG